MIGGFAVSKDDEIFVTDCEDDRVHVFSARDGTTLRRWGSHGHAPGQMNRPMGVVVTRQDEVLVADAGNDRIQVFTTHGTFCRSWGMYGPLTSPMALALTHGGAVVVLKTGAQPVSMFRVADGTFVCDLVPWERAIPRRVYVTLRDEVSRRQCLLSTRVLGDC